MTRDVLNIAFNAKIEPVKPLNENMTLCKCYVLALDDNYNGTHFGEKAVTDAIPTLSNIPVVGNVYKDDDGVYRLGGHDMELVIEDDNSVSLRMITVPYGVVPESNNAQYEEVTLPSGEKETYLVADVILWTGRYPELMETVYSEDVYFNQSMEINAKQMSKKKANRKSSRLPKRKEVWNIEKFEFSALCLLGKSDDPEFNMTPCFPNASVLPYHLNTDGDGFADLMEEFKSQLSQCYSDIKNEEEGNMVNKPEEVLEEKPMENSEEAVATEEEVQEEIPAVEEPVEEPTEEEGTKEPSEAEDKENPVEEGEEAEPIEEEPEEDEGEEEPEASEGEEEVAEEYSTSGYNSNFIRAELQKIISAMNVENVYHYIIDFTDTAVVYQRDNYGKNEYGAFKRGYVFNKELNKMEWAENSFEVSVDVEWVTAEEKQKLIDERAALEAELSVLKEYKLEVENTQKKLEYQEVLSEFSQLAGNPEYQELLEEEAYLNYDSAQELMEKCFVIVGKLNYASNKNKTVSLATKMLFGAEAVKAHNAQKSSIEQKRSVEEEFMNKYCPKK